MKILVLAGGLSPERNVSLSSGAMVCEALRKRGHQAALMDLFYGLDGAASGRGLYVAPIPDSFKQVAREAPDLEKVRARRGDEDPSVIGPGVFEMCREADVVFLALHGACGEDGRIQAALDLLGVPYTGSGSLGSAVAMDKDLTKRLVAGKVNTPKWETVTVTEENLEELMGRIKLPVVVKPTDSGSSIGVYIAKNRAELKSALENAAPLLRSTSKAGRFRWRCWTARPCPPSRLSPERAFTITPTSTSPARRTRCVPPGFPTPGRRRWGMRR